MSKHFWNEVSKNTEVARDRAELSALWHAFREKYGAKFTTPFSQFRVATFNARNSATILA